MNKKVQIRHLGRRDYKDTWDYQEKIFHDLLRVKKKNRREACAENTPNYLLFVEHPHVYTMGKSGDIQNLLLSEEQLVERQATYYKINRGGDITYHGPGQIVGYPILDLENFFTDVHKYMRFLEEVVIRTLEDYNLKAERKKGFTGVWFDVGTPYARKICAMGVRASRWAVMHGFALNVNTDLSYFENIVPCGIKDKAVTSMNIELSRSHIDEAEITAHLIRHFSELFEAEMVEEV